LTIPEIERESPPSEPLKVLIKGGSHERQPKPKPLYVGLQVPRGLHPQVPEKGSVRQTAGTSWRDISRACAPKGMQGGGRPSDARPCPHLAFHPAQVCGFTSGWFHKGQKRHPNRPNVPRTQEKLCWLPLLGQRVLCLNGRQG